MQKSLKYETKQFWLGCDQLWISRTVQYSIGGFNKKQETGKA
jgi:hypothetical protein